jgi:hypothetical protein
MVNVPRAKKCGLCGKLRPVKRRPAHEVAFTIPYEQYAEINGGEKCGVCGAVAKTRRLHRDHDHRTSRPRGLLCFQCNAAIRPYMTLEWMRAAVAYLERTA